MKTFATTVALLVAGLFISIPSAHASEVSVFIGIGIGVHGGHHGGYNGGYHGGYHRPPVIFVPRPVYVPPPVIIVEPRPSCPPPVIIERPCHDPFVTTVYEERWVETIKVVGYDRYWSRYEGRWITVERTVKSGDYRSVPVEVTAYWYDDLDSYAYRGSDGFLHRVCR